MKSVISIFLCLCFFCSTLSGEAQASRILVDPSSVEVDLSSRSAFIPIDIKLVDNRGEAAAAQKAFTLKLAWAGEGGAGTLYDRDDKEGKEIDRIAFLPGQKNARIFLSPKNTAINMILRITSPDKGVFGTTLLVSIY